MFNRNRLLAHGISRIPGLKRIPVFKLLALAEIALLARAHIGRLTPEERRRLIQLVQTSRGRKGNLSQTERNELAGLLKYQSRHKGVNPKIEMDRSRITSLEEQKKEVVAEMKKMHWKQLDCGARPVAQLRKCTLEDGQPGCDAGPMKATMATYLDYHKRKQETKKPEGGGTVAPASASGEESTESDKIKE